MSYFAFMELGSLDLPRVTLSDMHPNFTALVLRMLDNDASQGFAKLARHLKNISLKPRQGILRALVADGIEQESAESDDSYWINEPPYDTAAFIYRKESAPSWADEYSALRDVNHYLTILFRREFLVAVYGDSSLLGAVQSWLDRSPYPPYRRIEEGILNAAFLQEGEARSMWLRGVHVPRSTKANTSHLGGTRLQDALLHSVHSSFTVGAARSLMPTDTNLQYLRGVIGVNPAKSQIWLTQALTHESFFGTMADSLSLIQRVTAKGISLDNPYPVLSSPTEGLKGVKGAFDIVTLPRSEVDVSSGSDDELLEAADLLENAFIAVRAVPNSSRFLVDVGEDGKIGGTLTGRISIEKKLISIKFGLSGEPTYLSPVRKILDALDLYADDLVTVYYESGHTAQMKHIYKQNIRPAPFPNWIFLDFSGFDISREKPDSKSPQKIHDLIGSAGEDSIFSWIAKRFDDGYLTCDDGSGEIADFIYLSNDGEVTLIHAKGAKQSGPNRHVAVSPYEVVVSQAEKNVKFLSRDSLLDRLKSSPVRRPATWSFGGRVDDRRELCMLLATLDSRMRFKVMVVQPHVSKALYVEAQRRAEDGTPLSPECDRMEFLENMLNIAHAGVVGSNADLFVVGSLL